MNIPTILYISGRYINSLAELRQVFETHEKEKLRSTILAAFKDGILASWLNEGDEECRQVCMKLVNLDWKKLGDIKTFEEIEKQIIADPGTTSPKQSQFVLSRYAEFKECFWSDNIKKEDLSIGEGGIIAVKDYGTIFTFKMVFEVNNPVCEIVKLNLIVCAKGYVQGTICADLNLNVKQNTKQVVEFKVDTNEYERFSDIFVKVDETETLIFKCKLNNGGIIHLRLSSLSYNLLLTMILVEGNPKTKIKSFYIADTVLTKSILRSGDEPNTNKPIVNLTYYDVRKYIREWTSEYNVHFRLPSKKEWIYAAKGGVYKDGYKYSGSDNLDEVAWYSGNSGSELHDVKGKKPNSLGLYDMSGNVWEITSTRSRDGHNFVCGGFFNSDESELILNKCIEESFYISSCWTGCRLACNVEEIEELFKTHPKYFLF